MEEHCVTVQQLLDFIEKNNIDRKSKIFIELHDHITVDAVKKQEDLDIKYTRAWSPVKYQGDNKLYLDINY